MTYKKTAINNLGGILSFFGIEYPDLNPAEMLQKAKKLTGYHDFGNNSFKDGLEQLLDSAKKEAELTTLGKILLYHETINLLCSRLSLYHERVQNPKIFEKEIKQPLVIMGMPRTGTTLLQNLLAQDPQFRTPLTWEFTLAPGPPDFDKKKNQSKIDNCKKNIQSFKQFAPQLDKIHPLEAELPEECIMAMAINFDSALFGLKYHVPSYQKWYNEGDKSKTYAEHKMILQYLQKNIPTKKWLLKTPAHTAHLNNLFDTYPDAMIVNTHRDMSKVVTSMASLCYHIRKIYSNKMDKKMIGEEIMAGLSEKLKSSVSYRQKHPEKANRFFDIYFDDFIKDPIDRIEKLYRYFDLELTLDNEKKMRDFLMKNPRYKYGRHEYVMEEYGINNMDMSVFD